MKSLSFRVYLLCIVVAFGDAKVAVAQTASDLFREIAKIKAIDNHSHAEKLSPNGEPDTEGDALSCGGLEFVSPPPLRLRTDNEAYGQARKELFSFDAKTMGAFEIKQYVAIKQKVMTAKGDAYPAWILDKLNIETMLANRIAMGRGLTSNRFRWVTYGDPYLLPFKTAKAREKNSDVRFFYEQEGKLFERFLAETKLQKLPATLSLYLEQFVKPSLERHKAEGAVAVKFVAAYYRSLSFEPVSKGEAEIVYRRYALGGEPTAEEYKRFQDFMFRFVAAESGKLGLAVHVHTGGGCGHFFNLRTANPILLEPILNDPFLRKTNFVLVHGGYPYTQETAFLLEKPNVYADFSAQTFLLPPQSLSRVLRSWLEYEPEKILFGSDASPFGPDVGWEESAWMTTNTARQALAIALSKMIEDGEITRQRALELARMVMRENAVRLYKLEH